MGMFDSMRCEHPLPAPNTEGICFQTKDLVCDLDTFVIKADGTLWREASPWGGNPLGHLSDYFGELRFYSFFNVPNSSGAWLEFRARFIDGRLYGPIVLISDERSAAPTKQEEGSSMDADRGGDRSVGEVQRGE